MKQIKKYILLAVVMMGMSSCELDLLDDPNALKPQDADVNFLTNNIQLAFRDVFNDASGKGMDVTRMKCIYGFNYDNAYLPTAFDNIWNISYANLLTDINTLVPLAEERNLHYHAGLAKVIKSYVLVTLVDYFGKVPYSQAIDPENFNPAVDEQESIYQVALGLLNEAIVNLQATSSGRPNDFYYTSQAGWIKLANTLKLKIALQTRLVNSAAKAEIEQVLANGNFIAAATDNFAFKYGTNIASPDSRDPVFANNYTNGAASGEYMSNYYMNLLYRDKGIKDPRLRYYFFRQTYNITTTTTEMPCIATSKPQHFPAWMPYCTIATDGYWGRDHLNGEGIPPDRTLRTIWGVYPAAGKFDGENDSRSMNQNAGGRGAGIKPIMMSSFVKFMLAEAALTLNVSGQDPKELLEQGVRESISTVMAFASIDPTYGTNAADVPTQDYIDTYVDAVLDKFDAATDNEEKLNIIVKEYFIALWGNGIEAYNTYRRTGKPADIQFGMQASVGEFYRSFVYPADYITRNSNAVQKTGNTQQVFWDNNPAGWIH